MITQMPFELVQVTSEKDIPASFKGTPFETLLRCNNLDECDQQREYQTAELLILMCMDHRKSLNLPERFSYIVRNAGANIRSNEFSMAYAIGVAGIESVAMIGHTDCGMKNLDTKRDAFISGMQEHAGWSQARAESFFLANNATFHMEDPALFVQLEAQRFQSMYPRIRFQPFLYDVADGRLAIVQPLGE